MYNVHCTLHVIQCMVNIRIRRTLCGVHYVTYSIYNIYHTTYSTAYRTVLRTAHHTTHSTRRNLP